jgi:hypothetical protein
VFDSCSQGKRDRLQGNRPFDDIAIPTLTRREIVCKVVDSPHPQSTQGLLRDLHVDSFLPQGCKALPVES